MDLQNRTVVVTGASSGLGAAFARALIDKGATVFGLARRKERLDELQAAAGKAFRPVVCDVGAEEDVARAFEFIHKNSDRVDVLINNAGLGRFGALDDLSVEDWDVQMNTNLRGVFLCTRAVLGTMKAQNAAHGFGGHIVNIGSVAGLLGNPKVGAYNATKFGLRGLSESLMKEVRQDGIKVTCVHPGSIETEFFSAAGVPISANPMTAADITSTVLHVIEAPDNYLISEVMMRPLRPAG
jgi:NADP-dependent 3-hydroxy acid dehydrogenase YdfG